MRTLLVGWLLAIPIALSAGGRASACSCGIGVAQTIWPLDGATDVPLDAPLVLASDELPLVGTKLSADDGTEIELIEQGRLEVGQFSCVNSRYLFLTPAQPLEPQSSYVVSAPGGSILAGLEPRPVHFVTGNALRDPTPPELSFHLYATSQPEGPALELYVETQLSEPIFVAIPGQQVDGTGALFPTAGSGSAADRLGMSFGVVDCATPTFIDVAGNTFSSPRLCEPSKCSAPAALVRGPCGGEPASPLSWEDWQKLPDGCSAPTEAAASSNTDGGCALTASGSSRARSSPLSVAAFAFLCRSLRRSNARRSPPRDAGRR